VLFRAGDDLLTRIRASLLRHPTASRGLRGDGPMSAWPAYPLDPPARAHCGHLGEMGHADDRATDFGPGDPKGERS
jgi:hypothetical protein